MEKRVLVVVGARVEQYQSAVRRAAQTTREFGHEVAAVAGSTDKKLRPTLDRAGRAGVAYGAALAVGAGLAARAAIKWESAWAGVTKTVDGTSDQMGALEDDLRGLARSLPATHQEIAAVAEAAGALGIKRENVADFTKTMIDLGETTDLTADQAATAMARIANILQTPQDQFDRLGSTVVDLGNKGASTEAEIVEMALRIAGAGKQIGLSEAEVLGFASALSSVGIEAEAGGSSLSRVMVEVANAVATGGDKLDTFAEIAGMTSDRFVQAFRTDAAGALVTFIQGLRQTADAGGNVFAVLEELSLGDIRVRDALLRAAGAGDLFRESLQTGTQAWAENTALAEEAEKRYATTGAQLEMLRNNTVDVAIALGDSLLPVIKGLAEGAEFVLDGLEAMPGPMRTTVAAGLALTGVVAALGGAYLLLAPKINEARASMAALAVQAPKTATALRVGGIGVGVLSTALIASTVVLGVFAREKGAARAAVEEFTAAVQSDTGLIGANTEALISNTLQRRDQLDDLARAGIAFRDVVAAIGEQNAAYVDSVIFRDDLRQSEAELLDALAEEDTLRNRLIARLVEEGEANYGLIKTLDELFSSADATMQQEEAREKVGAKTADTTKRLTGATDDYADSTDAATEALEAFSKALDSVLGVNIDAELAALRFRDALRQLSDAAEDNGHSLDAGSEKGDANREVFAGLAQDALRSAEAVAKQTGNVDKATRVFRRNRRAILDSAEAAGYNRDQVAAYLDKLGLVPSKVRTVLEAETDDAESAISRLRTDLEALTRGNWTIRAHFAGASIPDPPRAKRTKNADGNLFERHDPQIASPGAMRLWAEPETGGEAYIPLAPSKRTRSLAIWAETGRRLGVAGFAAGGITPGSVPAGGAPGQSLGSDGFAVLQAQHERGGLSDKAWEAELRNRLRTFQAWTQEWVGAYDELVALEEEREQKRAELAEATRRREDIQFELGEMGAQRYRKILRGRLGDFKKYSDEWLEARRQLDQLNEEIAQREAEREERQRERQDIRFQVGAMGAARYEQILQERLRGEKKFSAEWYAIRQQLDQLEEDKEAREEERAERAAAREERRRARQDLKHEFGAISTDAYLTILRERLAGTKKWTDEWAQLQRQITQIEREEAEKREQAATEESDRRREQEDVRFRLGELSAGDYLQVLRARLAAADPYTADWLTLRQRIDAFTGQVATASLPSFASGGFTAWPAHEGRLAVLHGQEVVLNSRQLAALGGSAGRIVKVDVQVNAPITRDGARELARELAPAVSDALREHDRSLN